MIAFRWKTFLCAFGSMALDAEKKYLVKSYDSGSYLPAVQKANAKV